MPRGIGRYLPRNTQARPYSADDGDTPPRPVQRIQAVRLVGVAHEDDRSSCTFRHRSQRPKCTMYVLIIVRVYSQKAQRGIKDNKPRLRLTDLVFEPLYIVRQRDRSSSLPMEEVNPVDIGVTTAQAIHGGVGIVFALDQNHTRRRRCYITAVHRPPLSHSRVGIAVQRTLARSRVSVFEREGSTRNPFIPQPVGGGETGDQFRGTRGPGRE